MLRDRSFSYEVEGGCWEFGKYHLKIACTPLPQLTNFFQMAPPYSSHFWVTGTTKKKKKKKKFTFPQDFTFSIFPIIPLLWLKKSQIKRKRSKTLLFLGHCSLIKNKKQTAVINILNLHIFVSSAKHRHFEKTLKRASYMANYYIIRIKFQWGFSYVTRNISFNVSEL